MSVESACPRAFSSLAICFSLAPFASGRPDGVLSLYQLAMRCQTLSRLMRFSQTIDYADLRLRVSQICITRNMDTTLATTSNQSSFITGVLHVPLPVAVGEQRSAARGAARGARRGEGAARRRVPGR